MTEFDKLVGELETLHKALPKGDELADEKIEAASGNAEGEEGKEKTDNVEADVKKGDKKKPLAKSLTVTLEDGTQMEGVDGTELVKSLTEGLGALTARFDTNEGVLGKALGSAILLIKAQGERIDSLVASVKAMGSEGRGRKAVVTMVEKPATLAKGGDAEQFNPTAFMAKAEAQFKAGAISGQEISHIESAFNRGIFELPQALVAKVTG